MMPHTIDARLTRAERTLSGVSTRRLLAWFAVALFAIQCAFTAAVRGYVVPKLTPAAHWQFGLQRSSDGQAFHLDAARLAERMRTQGWRQINDEVFEGMSHTKIIAAVYYLVGRDTPWAVYLLNAVLFAVSGLLLVALLASVGVRRLPAVLVAGAIACSPLTLFSHSDLLREPFILPCVLLFVVGLMQVLDRRGASGWRRRVASAAAAMAGFVAAATFRPYLLLLLLFAAALTFALVLLSLARKGAASPFGTPQAIVTAGLLSALTVYAVPQARGVHRYNDESVLGGATLLNGSASLVIITDAQGNRRIIDIDAWRRLLAEKGGTSGFSRADFMVPHWCTVQWRSTWWMPGAIDRKLQSIACAREDYLRFCDQRVFGTSADRFCDESNFSSAAGALAHLPRAFASALLVPLPRMWVDSFGGGGTGLRRAGYVIDGIAGYALLAGVVVFLWRHRRGEAAGAVVCLALIAILTVYGLAVPTQFILARLRLAIFVPLLAFGAAGWLLWVDGRRAQRLGP